ncbi:hypothetical protein C823_004477 [Eubacterium plexicaudatum ASF492]|nr:hypothetical protein C823_004477 [Eubacterium plexicaudatum ASF492]
MTKQTTPTSSYKEVRIGKTIYRVTSFFREKRTWERRWNSWQSDAPCRKPFQLPAVPNNRKPRGLPYPCAAVDSPVRYSCRVKPAEPFCRTRYGF